MLPPPIQELGLAALPARTHGNGLAHRHMVASSAAESPAELAHPPSMGSPAQHAGCLSGAPYQAGGPAMNEPEIRKGKMAADCTRRSLPQNGQTRQAVGEWAANNDKMHLLHLVPAALLRAAAPSAGSYDDLQAVRSGKVRTRSHHQLVGQARQAWDPPTRVWCEQGRVLQACGHGGPIPLQGQVAVFAGQCPRQEAAAAWLAKEVGRC